MLFPCSLECFCSNSSKFGDRGLGFGVCGLGFGLLYSVATSWVPAAAKYAGRYGLWAQWNVRLWLTDTGSCGARSVSSSKLVQIK